MAFDINDLKGIFIVSRTQTLACHIQSIEDWLNFIVVLFTYRRRSKPPLDIYQRKETAYSKMDIKTKEQHDIFGFKANKFIDCVLCTAFDHQSQKRILII
jgi:hypothetical protein